MAPAALIDPSLRIGSIIIAVADLARSADFYERVLGLPLIRRDDELALFGGDAAQPALELSAIADPTPLSPHDTGLFHVAWLHPSRAALAETVQRIMRSHWPIEGASDHGVSEAIYLSDTDGLGIEVYADRSRASWEREPDGRLRMVSLPLDVEDLLAQAPGEPDTASETIAPGTGIGHVHLKVADVPHALAFYRDTLGLEEQAQLPSAAFLSAGGYHHHIAVNSWQSQGASPPPPNAPGLREIHFTLNDGDRPPLTDPDGNNLSFGPAAAG